MRQKACPLHSTNCTCVHYTKCKRIAKAAILIVACLAFSKAGFAESKLFNVLDPRTNGPLICGQPPYGADVYWLQKPWFDGAITISAASLDLIVFGNGRSTFVNAMIGDSFEPDPITPMKYAIGNDVTTLHNQTPATFVSMKLGPGESSHLDVHIGCNPGEKIQGFVWISYTRDESK